MDVNGFAPQSILAATDFSDVSTYALRHAAMWAQRWGARLTVLHVQEPPPIWSDPYLGAYNLTGLVEATWKAAAQHLEEHVREIVPADVPVSRELMAGSAPNVIEEFVAAGGIDLVVLGTHGRRGLSRLLLGSVAERALRLAGHPTLIVRQPVGKGHPAASTLHLRHILCPVNYTSVARAAFEHAAAVARTFDARLTVVFVVEPNQEHGAPGGLRRLEEELEAWLSAEEKVAHEIRPLVRRGDAAEQIVTLAREADVDLVVIGAQHRRFVDSTVLGVTTVRVTRHAPCPVLVVPRPSDT